MKLGKANKESGFVLMESLVSLGILVLLTAGTLPFFIDLFLLRQEEKTNTEQARLLYETALFWERETELVQILSSGDTWNIESGPFSIKVKGEGCIEKQIEILSVVPSK